MHAHDRSEIAEEIHRAAKTPAGRCFSNPSVTPGVDLSLRGRQAVAISRFAPVMHESRDCFASLAMTVFGQASLRFD